MGMLKNISSGGQFYSEMAADSVTISGVTVIDGGSSTSDSGYSGDPYIMLGIDADRDGVIDGGGYRMDPDGFHILSDMYVSGTIYTYDDTLTQSEFQEIVDNTKYVDLRGRTVNIYSGVTIGSNRTVVNGIFNVYATSGTVFYLQGIDVKFNNNTIYVYGTVPTGSSMYVVDVRNFRQQVTNNIIVNDSGSVHAGNCHMIRMASVYQNVNGNMIVDYAGDYIYAAISVTRYGERSTISDNIITNGKCGIRIEGQRMTCTSNTIYSINSNNGIYVTGSSGYVVVSNNFCDQYLRIYNSKYVTLTGNDVMSRIYINISNTVSVTGNKTYQVWCSGSANLSIVGNVFNTASYVTSCSSYKVAHNTNDSSHIT